MLLLLLFVFIFVSSDGAKSVTYRGIVTRTCVKKRRIVRKGHKRAPRLAPSTPDVGVNRATFPPPASSKEAQSRQLSFWKTRYDRDLWPRFLHTNKYLQNNMLIYSDDFGLRSPVVQKKKRKEC